MDLHEYAERDATDLAALIAAGEVTRAEVEACAREAAERLNPELNFLAQPLTQPLPGAETGPFAGVPFLTKDLVLQVEGVRQGAGSRMLDAVDFVPPASAALFERFRAAGLTLMGTTTTPEFGFNGTTEALLYGGPTRNPFDPGRSPGAPRAARRRRSRPEWCRWRMPTTAAARSASRRRPAGSSGRSPRADARPSARPSGCR